MTCPKKGPELQDWDHDLMPYLFLPSRNNHIFLKRTRNIVERLQIFVCTIDSFLLKIHWKRKQSLYCEDKWLISITEIIFVKVLIQFLIAVEKKHPISVPSAID